MVIVVQDYGLNLRFLVPITSLNFYYNWSSVNFVYSENPTLFGVDCNEKRD